MNLIFDEKIFDNLFDGYNFPYLVDFTLKYFCSKRLKKELLNGFPALRRLKITICKIEVIENDSFSDFEKLCFLNLSHTRIGYIEKNAFSNLKNLQTPNLSHNYLTSFDPEIISLRKTVQVKIEKNNFKI